MADVCLKVVPAVIRVPRHVVGAVDIVLREVHLRGVAGTVPVPQAQPKVGSVGRDIDPDTDPGGIPQRGEVDLLHRAKADTVCRTSGTSRNVVVHFQRVVSEAHRIPVRAVHNGRLSDLGIIVLASGVRHADHIIAFALQVLVALDRGKFVIRSIHELTTEIICSIAGQAMEDIRILCLKIQRNLRFFAGIQGHRTLDLRVRLAADRHGSRDGSRGLLRCRQLVLRHSKVRPRVNRSNGQLVVFHLTDGELVQLFALRLGDHLEVVAD